MKEKNTFIVITHRSLYRYYRVGGFYGCNARSCSVLFSSFFSISRFFPSPPPYEVKQFSKDIEQAREQYFIADWDENRQRVMAEALSAMKRESEDLETLMARAIRQRTAAFEWIARAGKFEEQLKQTITEIKEQAKNPHAVRLSSPPGTEEKQCTALLEDKKRLEAAMLCTLELCRADYKKRQVGVPLDRATLKRVAVSLAMRATTLEEYLQSHQASLIDMPEEDRIVKSVVTDMKRAWEEVNKEMKELRRLTGSTGVVYTVASTVVGLVKSGVLWSGSALSWMWSQTPLISRTFARDVAPGSPIELTREEVCTDTCTGTAPAPSPSPSPPLPSAPLMSFDAPIEVSAPQET